MDTKAPELIEYSIVVVQKVEGFLDFVGNYLFECLEQLERQYRPISGVAFRVFEMVLKQKNSQLLC